MGTLALGSLLPFEDRTARTLSLLCGRAFPRGGQGALIAPPVRTDVRTDVRNTDAGRKPRSVRISVCEIRVTDVRRPYGRGTSAPTIPHNAPRVSTAQTLRDSFRCTQSCSISTVQTGYRHQ